MVIKVNGETQEIQEGVTVLAMLESLGMNPEGTVVERNAEILGKEAFGKTVLEEGDTIEVIQFVGGG